MVDTLHCRCRFAMIDATGGDDGDSGWVLDPNGCPVTLSPSDVAAHEAVCDFDLLTCGNASRAGVCCGVQMLRRDGAAHAGECALRPLPCPKGCGAQLAECDLAAHAADDCPRSLLRCRFFGCHARMRREDVARHDAERMADHLAGERQARLAHNYSIRQAGPDMLMEGVTAASAALRLLLDSGASAADVLASLVSLTPLLASVPAAITLPDGVCASVAEAMCAHAAHARVQAAALKCLCFLAPNLRNGDAAAAAAAAALLAAMGSHGADLSVQQRACAALVAGWPSGKPGRSLPSSFFAPSLATGGGIAALLAALRTHAAEPTLQAAGLRALSFAHNFPDDAAAAAAEAALHAGAADAASIAVAALQRHPLDAGVAQHACALLRAVMNRAFRSSSVEAKEAATAAVVAAAPAILDALLNTVAAHRTRTPAVLDALAVLHMLFQSRICAVASTTLRVPAIYDGSGVALLMHVLRDTGGQPDVAEACMRAIAGLTFHASVATGFSFDADVNSIIAALHADNARQQPRETLASNGAAALARLVRCGAPSRVSSSLVHRMLVTLLEAARNRRCSAFFHTNVFSLLMHLSAYSPHRARMVGDGALPAVVAGMQQLPLDAGVQKGGCEVFAALCAQTQPQYAELARTAGALDAVRAAAAAFPGAAEGVAVAAAAALRKLEVPPGVSSDSDYSDDSDFT